MSYFTNNRQLVKSIKVNTGTVENPTYTEICCATERNINFDMEEQDFYVFCDALKRHVTTGADVSIDTILKLDATNAGVLAILGNLHTLLASGAIAQFNNIMIQFELLSGYSDSTLIYTTYNATTNLTVESLGGAAEDVSEIAATFKLNGAATAASV